MSATDRWMRRMKERPTLIFQDLMRVRVRHILLVSSLYDSFILTEDGQVNQALIRQFVDLNLHNNPDLIRVSSGEAAIALARDESRFDMIVTRTQLGDMNAVELARRVKEAGLDIPVVLLAYDNRELTDFQSRHGRGDIARVFLWQGDVRVLLAMVKDREDVANVARDTGMLGVPALLVVEDNIRFYSSLLPVIYTELMKHSQRLISEGVNISQKRLRTRARTKVLLCEEFEEAWEYFRKYEENILGVLSDFEFPRRGVIDKQAGVELISRIHSIRPDIPIVMQSSIPENEAVARKLGAFFLLKGSPVLLHNLKDLMLERLGFGDFVFRMADDTEIDRAHDLPTLIEKLKTVPAESLAYHGERNHFSTWLKARTEFTLAERLRPRKISEYATLEDLRSDLVDSISAYRLTRDRAVVADFVREDYDSSSSISRIGTGSLGGKARGLAFINRLLQEADVASEFPGVEISVPPAVVLATDVFDQFLEQNNLEDFLLRATSGKEIARRISEASLPDEILRDLEKVLRHATYPLAVRSSGLLEDSPSQPLAGIYRTVMLPNQGPFEQRMAELIGAIKSVYASTFSPQAKEFLRMTAFRLEEERMAVIIQKIVGVRHGDRFYPDFAGVARSHNFYPSPPMKASDGIAAVALGMGRTVAEGNPCLRFCPRFPRHLPAHDSVDSILENSQREFYALDISGGSDHPTSEGPDLKLHDLRDAEEDGTLAALASTYSPQNNAVSDGTSRPGVRLVTFAPILKHGIFPLAELLELLLEIGCRGTGADVEIEFAVNLSARPGRPRHFGVLQMRPLSLSSEHEALEIAECAESELLCRSRSVLGHGKLTDLRDIVVVGYHTFDRLRSVEVAEQIARVNTTLQMHGIPYLLIGVGRWGSTDRHLGIPVTWNQIAGARVIVESGFRDMRVTPSQGTHFFQNLTSLNVGYFTVNPRSGDDLIDWSWLAEQEAIEDSGFVRHIRLRRPLTVAMSGKTGEGIILKPKS